MVVTEYLRFSTRGNTQVLDITPEVRSKVQESGARAGIVNVSVIGSTGAITTCEFEPGLVKDIKCLLDRLIPAGEYHHDQAWGDGNGHAHLRSTFLGSSATFPFKDKELLLGTWQQIIFIDLDNRPRQRELVVQIIGE